MKKISVIIPVYNGSKYLRRCFDSILNQQGFNIEDLEIIVINDGSKDTSQAIIDDFANRHPKIFKVINQDNMGVADTRNKGINLAGAEYLMFVDQDDYLDKDYCAVLYQEIVQSGADVVSSGYRRPNRYDRIKQSYKPSKNKPYSKYILMAAWAKIHKTDFLKVNKIEFYANRIGEDTIFTLKEIECAKHWRQIQYVGYNWYLNEDSVSNSKQKMLDKENLDSIVSLLKRAKAIHKDEKSKNLFHYFILRTVVFYLLFSGKNETSKNFVYGSKTLFNDIESRFPGIYKNRMLPLGPSGESFLVRIAIPSLVIIRKLKLLGVFAKIYCQP